MATISIAGLVKRTRVAILPILPNPLMATLIFFILCANTESLRIYEYAKLTFIALNLKGAIRKFAIIRYLYYFFYSRECNTNPLLSFGSNQVVLGGIMLPVSAISISCFIVT